MSQELDSLDSLDSELADLAEQVLSVPVEPSEVPPQSPQEQLQADILGLLQGREDKPSEEQLEAWRTQYGPESLQLLSLDPENVYIYTHITLGQWEKIQLIMQQAAERGMQAEVEKMLKHKVIKTAVLWPVLDEGFFKTCRAGLPDTLYQLILMQSYFLTPQQAMTLTVQL